MMLTLIQTDPAAKLTEGSISTFAHDLMRVSDVGYSHTLPLCHMSKLMFYSKLRDVINGVCLTEGRFSI